MSVENKLNFGEDILKIPMTIGVREVEHLLMNKDYSVPKAMGNYLYKLVPNDGKHNVVTLDFTKREITWFYTAPDGKEQTKEIIDYFKKLFKAGGKALQ